MYTLNVVDMVDGKCASMLRAALGGKLQRRMRCCSSFSNR